MTDPVAERDAGVMAAATQIVDDMIRPLPTSEERRELRDAIYDFGIALVLSERQRGREEMRDRAAAMCDVREIVGNMKGPMGIVLASITDALAEDIRSLSTED